MYSLVTSLPLCDRKISYILYKQASLFCITFGLHYICNTMLHHFKSSITDIPLPKQFTYPFCYTPHPLCVMATEELKCFLSCQDEWKEELSKGKMFGVLVVQSQDGDIGYLSAFSGLLAGSNNHPHFVPPIYDLLSPQGFFKNEEENISKINSHIKLLEEDEDYISLLHKLNVTEKQAEDALCMTKALLKESKKRRDSRRKELLNASEEDADLSEELALLIRESQFQKAEYKRTEAFWKDKTGSIRTLIEQHEHRIQELKTERKRRSATLQLQLFDSFKILNYRKEVKTLCDIFSQTIQKTPPAGAGECAAPKLLQYAYLHNLKPIAMAEFWWGNSPKTEIRHHGHYYPACKSKCEPILNHALQGLDVEDNPMALQAEQDHDKLKIVYEDEWLIVVNKPAGMLSVPGKIETESVYSIMKRNRPDVENLLMVHRLDMATSGLLVIAKNKYVHKHLQKQFTSHSIRKTYIALVEGIVEKTEGVINLPICPNPTDSPRQMVDMEHGKPAVTHYKVIEHAKQHTRIVLYPLTGRTHQLRMHAAHAYGLNHPIVGDELYGRKNTRLFLHAQSIEFIHPHSGDKIQFTEEADF